MSSDNFFQHPVKDANGGDVDTEEYFIKSCNGRVAI
jgi:hypothetical protein